MLSLPRGCKRCQSQRIGGRSGFVLQQSAEGWSGQRSKTRCFEAFRLWETSFFKSSFDTLWRFWRIWNTTFKLTFFSEKSGLTSIWAFSHMPILLQIVSSKWSSSVPSLCLTNAAHDRESKGIHIENSSYCFAEPCQALHDVWRIWISCVTGGTWWKIKIDKGQSLNIFTNFTFHCRAEAYLQKWWSSWLLKPRISLDSLLLRHFLQVPSVSVYRHLIICIVYIFLEGQDCQRMHIKDSEGLPNQQCECTSNTVSAFGKSAVQSGLAAKNVLLQSLSSLLNSKMKNMKIQWSRIIWILE